jgi:hypothetical protein
MLYSIAAVFTTHPSFDKNAIAFSPKSTFPYQGRLRRECRRHPVSQPKAISKLVVSQITSKESADVFAP